MSSEIESLIRLVLKYPQTTINENTFIVEYCTLLGNEKIVDIASQRKVLPFFALVLNKLEIDKSFWEEIVNHYIARNTRLIVVLDMIFHEFYKNEIHKVFVSENFGALLSSNNSIALFSSGDIDLYADPKLRLEIIEVMSGIGFTAENIYARKKIITTRFTSESLLSLNFSINIGWELLTRSKLPSFIKGDDIINWMELSRYKNTYIRMPNRETLIYICLLHISLHSFSRSPDIRLYVDISNLLSTDINFSEVIKLMKQNKSEKRVLTSLYLSNKLLGTTFPNDLLYLNEKTSRIKKILKIVYNKKENLLKLEPRPYNVLYLELLLNDQGLLYGLRDILFPNSNWVRMVYLDKDEYILLGYTRHLLSLLYGGRT